MSFGLFGSKVYSLEEIGNKFELRKERIRQIRDKAIRKLRNEGSLKLLLAS